MVVVDREANDLKEEVAQAVRQQKKAYIYISQTMVKNVLKKIEFTLGQNEAEYCDAAILNFSKFYI